MRLLLRIAGVTAIALTAANCSKGVGGIDPKYGVAASPRVVRDGEAVPKGGGRNMVGKPYTVAGKTYVPTENPGYAREGLASWYGSNFHGRLTANGEVFDRGSIAAAHTTMPLPSYARVTNVQNGHSMIVRVNDRGPYHGNRVIDVSERAAEALGFRRAGTAQVKVEYVGRASTNGSDDRILLSSLRTDGSPASLGNGRPTMLAEAPPAAPVRQVRQTITMASYEASEQVETVTPIAGNFVAAEAARAINHVPLPPERPFDLGTIPGAATPVRTSAQNTGGRPVVAGLYYAEPQQARGFQRSAAFGSLDQAKFVSKSTQN
ncbi:septal ring lytic transglycosylase RlpA family protein [Microvirga pudoricolor]|uniref:septal ring lytic transglycosylase RlpA family protein n=1 Tax=Microvirga pudoricolor TaxID=2778729 RepID=UPI0019525867|nr:septal ring lytic transglycosylase RlpA family protein [Microvirga pudoricolor]MBM6595704.1 septal ring lytic transglycosylase RlpA family protein [Microvirga pudoricolor]